MVKPKPKLSLLTLAISFFLGAALAALVVSSLPNGRVSSESDTQVVPKEAIPGTSSTDIEASFPSWNPDAASLVNLVAYVEDVCDASSPHFVASSERVATFGVDGTVLAEKAPVCLDYCLLLHRVLEDGSYTPDAKVKETCERIAANARKGVVDSSLNARKSQMFAQVFAGMTPEEFYAYAIDFIDKTEVEGFGGMTYAQSFFAPMLEVIDYLKAHDFDIYLVSASEREVVRAVAQRYLKIPLSNVIGSDLSVEATGQGKATASDYQFTSDDDLVFGGKVISDCSMANKVVYIQREIGVRPILAFGNGVGDFSMLTYAQTNPDHRGMGLLVVADDEGRDHGSAEVAKDIERKAAEAGWTTISMRDDWTTIYGDGVVKTAFEADTKKDEAA